MSASPGIKIAIAGVVAILVIYFGFIHQPGARQEDAKADSAAVQQVEQRLKQLHAAHDQISGQGQARDSAGTTAGGKIDAGSKVTAQVKRLPQPRLGGEAPNAPDAAGNGDGEIDVDPDDIPALANIALHDKDPERRLAAVTMLGSSEDPAVLTTLAQALSDEDDEVRMAAIQSLSDFTGDAPIDLLSKVVVEDPSADNRYEALEALSDLGGDRAASAIQKALNDPDEDVRALAEGMLDMEENYQDVPDSQPAAPTPGVPPAP